MSYSTNLGLPYLLAAQAQKHVTHNEALRMLDALVQLSVRDRDASAPPASPVEGHRYIVAANPTGAWADRVGQIAAYQDGAWAFITPREGFRAWVEDEDFLIVFDGEAWTEVGTGGGSGVASVNPAALVGVNAVADVDNRLSVRSPASLFNHDGGGHQLKVNKSTTAATAAALFQTAFSGRAEMGLTGDDNFHLKVSADGSAWIEAMVIDRASGQASFPATPAISQPNLLINGDFQINQRVFAGGALSAGTYGYDRWKADTGGASVTRSGQIVTLASGALIQVIETEFMVGQTLASTTVTVSVEDLTADLNVSVGSATATVTAGAGRRAAVLALGAGDGGNLVVRLARSTAGSVSFSRVKLERGTSSTPWQARPRGTERVLADRYFQKSYQDATALGVVSSAGALSQFGATTTVWLPVRVGTRFRTTPTVAVYSTATGAAGKLYDTTSGDLAVTVTQIGEQGFVIYGGGNLGAFQYAQFAASAEL